MNQNLHTSIYPLFFVTVSLLLVGISQFPGCRQPLSRSPLRLALHPALSAFRLSQPFSVYFISLLLSLLICKKVLFVNPCAIYHHVRKKIFISDKTAIPVTNLPKQRKPLFLRERDWGEVPTLFSITLCTPPCLCFTAIYSYTKDTREMQNAQSNIIQLLCISSLWSFAPSLCNFV